MCIMEKPPLPSPKHVRLTITVTPEVHATFQRMAAASGMSLGKAMGEWLADTVEAAEFMTTKMEQARAAPRMVIAEMQAAMTGVQDELSTLMSDLRTGRKVPPTAERAGGRPVAAAPPRPVIRGGNSPGKTRTRQPKGGKS